MAESCTQGFSDGEDASVKSSLSLDVPLNENYNLLLPARAGPGDSENTAHDFPMFWEPTVNCPYYETGSQLGTGETDYLPAYSAHQARSTAYAGVVDNATMPNLVLFDYFDETEDELLHGAEHLAREFQDLKPSLLAPLESLQPVVTLNSDMLRARAFSEDLIGASA